MTMHDQLPDAPDSFDVGQRPTADEQTSDPEALHAEAEVARLEKLLAAQSLLRRQVTEELARRSALLRDALLWLNDIAPDPHSQQLRVERDAAVARTVEAELARAELTFRLDEALGFLKTGATPDASALPAREPGEPAPTASELRTLRARVAELEELSQTADARRLLIEDELAHEQTRLTGAARDRVEAIERLELQLSELSVRNEDAQRRRIDVEDARSALEGELDGLRYRVQECERALRGTQEQLARARRNRDDLQDKLDANYAAQAGQAARAEASSVRVQELLAARSADHEALRQLRIQLVSEQTLRSDQVAQLTAAQAELRSRPGGGHEAAPKPDAGQGAVPGQPATLDALRGVLSELRRPLLELESALAEIGRGGRSGVELSADGSHGPVDPEAYAALEQELRAREARIAELEARPSRDASLSTLKGELIDVRANSGRLADDLAKERSRRRKIAVTVRALQAAAESGEAPGPWIDELVVLVNEGSSLAPKA